MRKLIILALAAISFAACSNQPQVPEDAVRELCEYMVRTYPQATLQDLYKTCYQDFFGPGHMVTDSASALGYIHHEVEDLRSEGVNELTSDKKDEPTGFRHRFVRVDLRRIVLGEMNEKALLCRFMDAANTATPVHNDWAGEWKQIEAIALQVHPQWTDTELQASLREAAKANRAVHQSDAYREAYHPHYRLVKMPVVYMTRDISPEGLVRIYEALGREATGRVAVKISTGEAGGHHFLQPALIEPLVTKVNGTIVECNTAYPGKRNTFEAHWQTIKEHGFLDIASCDLMDEDGDMRIPVQDSTWIQYDIVGKHLANYDFMINLAHFKGHAMGGFGGVLKNQSIGVASSAGKAYIHSAGITDDVHEVWSHIDNQEGFLESMAAAAQAVHDYFGHGERILYINVANNLSVDCDCDSHPAAPEMNDLGILASLDPVALDQACVDLVFNYPSQEGDDAAALIERINTRHGIHILEQAEKIGLGSRQYQLVSIDSKQK